MGRFQSFEESDGTIKEVDINNEQDHLLRMAMHNDIKIPTTTDLVRNARSSIDKMREELKASNANYRLDLLVEAMLDHAISDGGTRYVALAVQIASGKGWEALVEQAQAWVDLMFLPGKPLQNTMHGF